MKLKTPLERKLFRWLYRSQEAFAKHILKKMNEDMKRKWQEKYWPAQQEWDGMVGSSHAIFMRKARQKARIPHEPYLNILRNN